MMRLEKRVPVIAPVLPEAALANSIAKRTTGVTILARTPTHIARNLLTATSVLMLVACSAEHEVSEAEINNLMLAGDDVYEVGGKPFSGALVVRKGNKIRIRVEMEDGHVHGALASFHDNGQPERTANRIWDPEERVSVIDGESLEWNQDGVMVERMVVDAGEFERIEHWCDDASPKSRKDYENGTPSHMQQWDCDTGKQTGDARFNSQGQVHGEQKQWAPDGTLISLARYENGRTQGLQEEWHGNGKPKSRGEFEAGKAAGKHEVWDAQGTLSESGLYDKAGHKSGVWLENGPNGLHQVHYGPEGFIQAAISQPYIEALRRGPRANADTVGFYLSEGAVKPSDALPAGYNGAAVAGGFKFPQTQWTYAVVVADDAVLPTLLAQGADLNQADSSGATRLMRCAEIYNSKSNRAYAGGCSPEHLSDLLAKGAKADSVDLNGRNVLHYLMANLSRSDKSMWGSADEDASLARTNTMVELIRAGADVNRADRSGFTPLVLALSSRRADLAHALLENGARAGDAGPAGTYPIHWVFLKTTTSYAISEDEFTHAMLAELAKRGADVKLPMSWDGDKVTLRDLAMRHGRIDLVRELDTLSGD